MAIGAARRVDGARIGRLAASVTDVGRAASLLGLGENFLIIVLASDPQGSAAARARGVAAAARNAGSSRRWKERGEQLPPPLEGTRGAAAAAEGKSFMTC
ncbi:unnamed protein product [Lepidochelys olivacea]